MFEDGTFEFVPMPDKEGIDAPTYGELCGRCGPKLVEYFPSHRRNDMRQKAVHTDPEFETFTYGDPIRLRSSLKNLEPGDILAFYCGLQGWPDGPRPALYLIGYFEVETAGKTSKFGDETVDSLFATNFHVKYRDQPKDQWNRLVLVKGSRESRLLKKAEQISAIGRDGDGRPMYVLSEEAKTHFGPLGGKGSIQRGIPRWVSLEHAEKAAMFLRGLHSW
jgi:hypothetical protein